MSKCTILLLVLVFEIGSCVIYVEPVFVFPETAQNQCITLTPMPTARGGLGIAVVEGLIYAIGGYNGTGFPTKDSTPTINKIHGSCLGTNEVYDQAKNIWASKAPMPTPRVYFGIVTFRNRIFCFGGLTQDSDFNLISSSANEVYDPMTNTWESRKSLPIAGAGLHANLIGEKIYLIGGHSNETIVYDPITDSCTKAEPLPIDAAHSYVYDEYSTSVSFEEKIHYIGYSDMGNFHLIYDSKSDSWSEGSAPSDLPAFAAGGATSGVKCPARIYVFGENSTYRTIAPWATSFPGGIALIYDPNVNAWTIAVSNLTDRVNFGVAVVADMFYLIGGAIPSINSNYNASSLSVQFTPVCFPVYVPETFPTILVATASLATVILVGVGLLVYFKKRKR